MKSIKMRLPDALPCDGASHPAIGVQCRTGWAGSQSGKNSGSAAIDSGVHLRDGKSNVTGALLGEF